MVCKIFKAWYGMICQNATANAHSPGFVIFQFFTDLSYFFSPACLAQAPVTKNDQWKLTAEAKAKAKQEKNGNGNGEKNAGGEPRAKGKAKAKAAAKAKAKSSCQGQGQGQIESSSQSEREGESQGQSCATGQGHRQEPSHWHWRYPAASPSWCATGFGLSNCTTIASEDPFGILHFASRHWEQEGAACHEETCGQEFAPIQEGQDWDWRCSTCRCLFLHGQGFGKEGSGSQHLWGEGQAITGLGTWQVRPHSRSFQGEHRGKVGTQDQAQSPGLVRPRIFKQYIQNRNVILILIPSISGLKGWSKIFQNWVKNMGSHG